MEEPIIPVMVIDKRAVKRRGVCQCVNEAASLDLAGQAANTAEAAVLVKHFCRRETSNPLLANWLVFSDLHASQANGVALSHTLLHIAPAMRMVLTTYDPGWVMLRQDSRRRGTPRGALTKQTGPHGYALFLPMEPAYATPLAHTVVRQHKTFLDTEVGNAVRQHLRGRRLTQRQEECASLVAQGLSNARISLRMGFLNAQGQPTMSP
jgi:DNA-binding NarL/FixJ family response regulator